MEILSSLSWNEILFYFEGIGNFFFSLQCFISDFWRGTRERGVQLTRCKDKSRTPFDSFISLPLFLSSYLKIFKDLLFVPLGEGGGDFLSFRIVICGPLPLPPPIHPPPPLLLPFSLAEEEGEAASSRRGPILGRGPQALPGYSLRVTV